MDLYENANLLQVTVIQIHRLGSVAAKLGFSGPALGVKMATANAREFTEEQMRAGLNTQTFMGAGSNDTAGAKLSMVETGRVQVRGNVAGTEGLGKGGEQTFIGTGSQDTAGAKMDLTENLGNKIVKTDIAGVAGLGKGSEQTFLGSGSSQTPGAQMNTGEYVGSNIVKTNIPMQ